MIKKFLREWLFGKTEQLLETKEIDLELFRERLNEFDFELKIKNESIELQQLKIKDELVSIENEKTLLKTKENNLISEINILNDNKELFEVEKQENETNEKTRKQTK